jgi:predicted DNA-binding protein with PD1-like motif
VQSSEENNRIIIKLDDGQNLFSELGKIMMKHGAESAIILSGIGMLQDFEIGYYDGGKYLTKHFGEPMELVSMHGSIAASQESSIHIHVALANEEHNVIGGHLMKAKVCVLNEIVLLKMDQIELNRALNDKSGLYELKISGGNEG